MNSIDQVYPSGAAPEWGIVIAEAMDSLGGAAGDGLTMVITETSPTNKHIFMFCDDVDFNMDSKDKTTTLTKGRSRTQKLGKYKKGVKLSKSHVPTRDMDELNEMTDQLEEWMLNGSAQTGEKQVYIALRNKKAGVWKYKTWKNSGVKQNWLKGEVKKVKGKIKHSELYVNLTFKESD